jgi:hypothetical protein
MRVSTAELRELRDASFASCRCVGILRVFLDALSIKTATCGDDNQDMCSRMIPVFCQPWLLQVGAGIGSQIASLFKLNLICAGIYQGFEAREQRDSVKK